MNDFYIVRVSQGGDTWYVHERGERVNSNAIAMRYNLETATAIAAVYQRRGAKVDVIQVGWKVYA